MTVLVGLELAADGAAAVAISPDGRVVARSRSESPEAAVAALEQDDVAAVATAGDSAEIDPRDAAALAVGALSADVTALSLGSSVLVSATVRGARRHVALPAAGDSLRWLHDAIVGESYEELTSEARRWPPGTEGLLFLPRLDEGAGAFVGLSLRHDSGALVRAVLEGVAYAVRGATESLRARPKLLRAAGGGARSELWMRIVASVLGVPVERAEESGAAFGAALLAGVSAGVFAGVEDAAERCVRVLDRFEPDPDWLAAYELGYERYRGLVEVTAARS